MQPQQHKAMNNVPQQPRRFLFVLPMPRVVQLLIIVVVVALIPLSCSAATPTTNKVNKNPPNVLIFLVDDLGWNQVGYHAHAVGNNEIQTPNIDAAAAAGIELNRGYVTPWCGPSRAAIMTGRTNVYNGNVSQRISTFDDDIGYVAGMPIGTRTIAHAFKDYGTAIGRNYTTLYDGKWGIGGTAWANTPLGMGFDNFRGSWGTGLETCDGVVPTIAVVGAFRPIPFDEKIGPLLVNTLPGYWEQNPLAPDSDQCPYFRSIPDDQLTPQEKDVACKTYPRTPPKIIDLDLLDHVVEQMETHDYDNAGPILQVFATMMLHNPMAYPDEYNEPAANDNYQNGMPEYFAKGKEKSPATIDDMRWATNKGVQFVDDIFGRTVQAIKNAGQWNNTIIYFTSDNGGVIYQGQANNNYPLRASKFSPFEGGIRTPQFISGGWIDQHLPTNRKRQSNTYIFPNDIAPTLLGMAGGDIRFLLGTSTGAPYGNQMWDYIKASVDPTKPKSSHQLVRKVSYAPEFFFDVQVNRTMKFFFNGDKPLHIPRLYEPIWPRNGDLIMDTMYFTVKPCRPNGIPSDCCSLNIEDDWQETNPLVANCSSMHMEAKNLFVIEGGCPKNEKGRNTNPICVERGEVEEGVLPSALTLWTHYGAAGPFTNSKGQPMQDNLSMKCVCYGLEMGASESNVDYFVVRNLGPSQCGRAKGLFKKIRPPQSIECDGTYSFDRRPEKSLLAKYVDDGFYPLRSYRRILQEEERKTIAKNLPDVLELLIRYISRSGKANWPAINKFPFNGDLDTCREKGVVPVPFPILALTPYIFGARESTLPFKGNPLGLCAAFSLTLYFCPAHQNPTLKPVVEWNSFGPYGVFADGTRWHPMGLIECSIKCRITTDGTAYIGDGPHGIVV